jgi:diadenosine tetraphosphate (Ap4A) HIT family hydrolase
VLCNPLPTTTAPPMWLTMGMVLHVVKRYFSEKDEDILDRTKRSNCDFCLTEELANRIVLEVSTEIERVIKKSLDPYLLPFEPPQNESIVVFKDRAPAAQEHFLIIPREHVRMSRSLAQKRLLEPTSFY